MPYQIIRNDITKVKADAIVNTANPHAAYGDGVDRAVYEAAGAELLLQERRRIGEMQPGEAAVTPAFALPAKYIIHTVGPAWQGGQHGERAVLRKCYRNCLAEANKLKCRTVAFPLLSSGSYGYPKDQALLIAIDAIEGFLEDQDTLDTQVYLVVFDPESVKQSICQGAAPAMLISDDDMELAGTVEYTGSVCQTEPRFRSYSRPVQKAIRNPVQNAVQNAVQNFLRGPDDDSFSERLLRLIDAAGEKDSMIYKKANVTKSVFSRIRSNPNYTPKFTTVMAFAFALRLSLDQTADLLSRAGYALKPGDPYCKALKKYILDGEYNIARINSELFDHDWPQLGNPWAK
jgi:O-acetyl-ADP-ribose deacetylase (regulator of RNase III)